MAFPANDRFWDEARRFLEENARPLDPVFAPTGFLDVHPGAYDYRVDAVLPPDHFSLFVFHKGMLDAIRPDFLLAAVRDSEPVFANEVFVITRHRRAPAAGKRGPVPQEHLDPFLAQVAEIEKKSPPTPARPGRTAVLVTTYNRSWAIERSLPQIAALGAPVLVVDDASDEPHRRANAGIAARNGALLLALPSNRGLACAINAGLSYWLADPSIEWISVFQDDVDVRPDMLDVLAKVQDARRRPYLTGRYNRKGFVAKEVVAGIEVYLQHSAASIHMHAHRDYWPRVMPVPTWYLGAPKPTGGRPGEGSNTDWWITAWAPRSITKEGGHVICIPGLVRHFAHDAGSSTWSSDPKTGPEPEF